MTGSHLDTSACPHECSHCQQDTTACARHQNLAAAPQAMSDLCPARLCNMAQHASMLTVLVMNLVMTPLLPLTNMRSLPVSSRFRRSITCAPTCGTGTQDGLAVLYGNADAHKPPGMSLSLSIPTLTPFIIDTHNRRSSATKRCISLCPGGLFMPRQL